MDDDEIKGLDCIPRCEYTQMVKSFEDRISDLEYQKRLLDHTIQTQSEMIDSYEMVISSRSRNG